MINLISSPLPGMAIGALVMLWEASCFAQSDLRAADRPNVLLIIADDMNDYGFHQAFPGVKMPHLDRFKSGAVTFRQAYCTSPVCGPSRASLFSGLHPHTTGAYLNGCDPWRQAPLKDIESLPELFRRSGYLTFGRGKLFHAPTPPERDRASWDNEPWGGGFGPFPPEDDQMLGKFWGTTPWTGPDSDFPDVKNADATIAFLGQEHEKPFFVAYGLWRPHTPFTAPRRFFDQYRAEDIPVPPPGYREDDLDDVPEAGRRFSRIWGERWESTGGSNPSAWRKLLQGYLATTSFADWSAGRVIEALDQSRYASNTIVIFWSDNGYHMGEKNHYEKATPWEKATLTPLAIRVPGGLHAGAVCMRPVSAIDLFPTLVDYCRLDRSDHEVEGLSLRPLLEEPSAGWDRPAVSSYGPGVYSARGERFRFIQYPDGTEELYDHRADPHELHNVADDPSHTGVKEGLKRWCPMQWAPSLGGRNG